MTGINFAGSRLIKIKRQSYLDNIVVKSLTFTIVGSLFLALGMIGLLMPFLPGFLFLLLAAACFASVSPMLKRRFGKHPRMSRFFRRIEAGESLDLISQLKLACWASLEALNPRRRTNWQSRKHLP